MNLHKIKLSRLFPAFMIGALLVLPSCFKDDDEKKDYSEWREKNEQYIDEIAILTEDGRLVYTPVTPVWDKSFTVYMRWIEEDDAPENPSDITPLSTSTCHVKYTLKSIDGEVLDSSESYTCVPNNMVTGFMAALTNMHVNDTVTAVIPYTAGYGTYGYGAVRPYSTLVFGIRLDSISRLM